MKILFVLTVAVSVMVLSGGCCFKKKRQAIIQTPLSLTQPPIQVQTGYQVQVPIQQVPISQPAQQSQPTYVYSPPQVIIIQPSYNYAPWAQNYYPGAVLYYPESRWHYGYRRYW